ncbi:MAG: sialate O-acetylesterase [Candidatus Fervidibacter sp.]|uniref:sialate O-acetylesterase n=1 Tax=Candidatus Fervidibacter sp. TaxID=3100871 RepID=UPI004049BA3D
MRRFKMWLMVVVAFWLTLVAEGQPAGGGSLRLPAIFGDHMVLQSKMPVPIWGWAAPREEVAVIVKGKLYRVTKAAPDGCWMVKLPPQPPGGPYELIVRTRNETTRFVDVLFGEVWICSGQSNMEWPVQWAQNAQQEIATANFPQIRFFIVEKAIALEPKSDCKGRWVVCSPETIGVFSAVGYFFGREIHKQLKVPVGLIGTYWGGTPAESWTELEELESDPDLRTILDRLPRTEEELKRLQDKYEREMEEWRKKALLADTGNKGERLGWASPDFKDSDWAIMNLPRNWESVSEEMNIDGAVWFRKVVTIPEDWTGKDLLLSLGLIDDYDVVYFNGEKIGSTGQDTPNSWTVQRRYIVPGRLVKAGPNLIAVRVFDVWGYGGFRGTPEQMMLGLVDGNKASISLSGEWKFKVEFARPAREVPQQPQPPVNNWTPTALFNAMVAPLIPYAIRGVIWYQGESNVGRAYQYRKLFPTLIKSWRRNWGQGDFPFLFVQLANYLKRKLDPTESAWAELREAQLLTLKTVPKTGMAVAIDIGEANDIHPRNKQDVGKRLASAALAVAYGRKVVYSGPIYRSMRIEGNKIRLFFDHVGSGLVAKGGELRGFAIAGKDGKFVWANAKIEGDTVLVWSEQVPEPVAVRYGWADNPDCNLYNKEGLPASPFRTDDFPGITVKIR